MKAISLIKPKTVEIVEAPEPRIGPEDVLLDVHYVGLCGSDLNVYRGSFQLATYPRILGHEVSGVVITKGAQVPDAICEGDRVTLSPYSECGVCPACRVGRTNCCQYNQTLGLQRDGALTDRFAVHYSKVVSSKRLSLEELVLVEPLSVGYHAANRGRVSEVDTALVLGCGTIGIGVIAAAARKGATMIAVDVDDEKLACAQRFGAQYAVNSAQQDVLVAIDELTDHRRVVYVGYAKNEVCYDTTNFVRKELDIRGARNSLRVFPAVVKMLEQRLQPFQELITRVYPFEETAQALRDWDAAPTSFTKVLIDVRA
jgi:threonine dehydrogenase-like Zn-dependent dehydrogenase